MSWVCWLLSARTSSITTQVCLLFNSTDGATILESIGYPNGRAMLTVAPNLADVNYNCIDVRYSFSIDYVFIVATKIITHFLKQD